jgi:hypothetical protein
LCLISSRLFTLVVNASAGEFQEISRLVASYDRAKQMLRVTIEQGKSLSAYKSEASTSRRVQNGNTGIVFGGARREPSDYDSFIKIDSGRNQLNVLASDNWYRESRQVSQFVSVLEGEPVFITVGCAVPFTSQLLTC